MWVNHTATRYKDVPFRGQWSHHPRKRYHSARADDRAGQQARQPVGDEPEGGVALLHLPLAAPHRSCVPRRFTRIVMSHPKRERRGPGSPIPLSVPSIIRPPRQRPQGVVSVLGHHHVHRYVVFVQGNLLHHLGFEGPGDQPRARQQAVRQ